MKRISIFLMLVLILNIGIAQASSGGKTEPKTVSLRENLQFFSTQKNDQGKNYGQPARLAENPSERAIFPKLRGVSNGDGQEIREEILRTHERMNQVTQDISESSNRLASMLDDFRNASDPRRRGSEYQLLAARINQLQTRLLYLRRQQNRFVRRMLDLRNALNYPRMNDEL